MNIKIPRIRIVRPQHVDVVTEVIIKNYLKLAFYISPLALWKAYELLEKVYIKWIL